MSRYQDYINAKTGEEATGMLIIRGSRYPRGVEFATLFTDGALHIATLGLTATELRVLLALIANMSFKNFVHVTQKALSDQLRIAASNVSAAIRRLTELGLVAKSPNPDDTGRTLLRISLHLAWRGTAQEWSAALADGEGLCFAPVPPRSPKRESKRRQAPSQPASSPGSSAKHPPASELAFAVAE